MKGRQSSHLTKREMDDLIRWEMGTFSWKDEKGLLLTKEAAVLAFIYESYGHRPFARSHALATFKNSFPYLGTVGSALDAQLAYGAVMMSVERGDGDVVYVLTRNGMRFLGRYLNLDQAIAA